MVNVAPFFVPSVQAAVLYIGLNGLITLILALYVSRCRLKSKIDFGDGGDLALQRAIRAHGNNVEYVPITLLTILGVAVLSASTLLVHILGIALTAGRVLHGIGLNLSGGASFGRGAGILLTWLALLAGAIAAILYATAILPSLPPVP
jgi:uncharacterized membrane protein YecN with MAPEG domain